MGTGKFTAALSLFMPTVVPFSSEQTTRLLRPKQEFAVAKRKAGRKWLALTARILSSVPGKFAFSNNSLYLCAIFNQTR